MRFKRMEHFGDGCPPIMSEVHREHIAQFDSSKVHCRRVAYLYDIASSCRCEAGTKGAASARVLMGPM
ncbi:hypothetical protein A5706_28415 [Mycobacterium sp. E796]|nr:hypothetical protein A5706_28415 [Mycobacterium sp. E796]